MSEPFVGEIRMFAGNFAPRGWAFCDGQLLAVSQNDALFSLFGTIYGGDGRTTFGLPDLRGRLPIHAGGAPGLTPRKLGQKLGAETVTLTSAQIPPHSHAPKVSNVAGTVDQPSGRYLSASDANLYKDEAPSVDMGAPSTAVGTSQGHTNLMPSLCVNFIVALVGIYPSRN